MRLLVERMGLRRDVQRLPIFGLGCAGGVIGLTRAAQLARAEPGSKILFLAVELCALTFRKNDISKSNIVATALFGDGAAGAILSTDGEGPEVGPAGEYTWPDSLDVMGWDMAEDGLKARFAKAFPTWSPPISASCWMNFLAATISRCQRHCRLCLSSRRRQGAGCAGRRHGHAARRSQGKPQRAQGIRQHVGGHRPVRRRAHAPAGQQTLLTALGPGFTAAFLMLDGRGRKRAMNGRGR